MSILLRASEIEVPLSKIMPIISLAALVVIAESSLISISAVTKPPTFNDSISNLSLFISFLVPLFSVRESNIILRSEISNFISYKSLLNFSKIILKPNL